MKLYRITRLGPSEYLLFEEGTDAAVRAAATPEELSIWAFANQGERVRHEYDGRDAENDAVRMWMQKKGGKR